MHSEGDENVNIEESIEEGVLGETEEGEGPAEKTLQMVDWEGSHSENGGTGTWQGRV